MLRWQERAFRVAVVVNATRQELSAMRQSGCFEAVQFHGDELQKIVRVPDSQCGFERFELRVRVAPAALGYETPYLLLDAWSNAAYGGTGLRLDWELVSGFVSAQPAKHVILAGGLRPENIREAIRIVHPYAVDVASGVESNPGQKSRQRVAEFLKRLGLPERPAKAARLRLPAQRRLLAFCADEQSV